MMTRSNHPLLLLFGLCALSASNAVAQSNVIESPHRLFRLRKSALNSDGSNQSETIATSVDASVEDVVETLDDVNPNELFDTNRQKDDEELLSMDTGGADGIELQDCTEVKVCPDPACAEMEAVVKVVNEDPSIFNRRSLHLRRHLESSTKSGKSASNKPVFLAKSGKMMPHDSQSPPTNDDPETTITQIFSAKSGKISKSAKGCKSGKGCKMVLQCTSTKLPAGTGIATAPPVCEK